jgi:hypothetical protein
MRILPTLAVCAARDCYPTSKMRRLAARRRGTTSTLGIFRELSYVVAVHGVRSEQAALRRSIYRSSDLHPGHRFDSDLMVHLRQPQRAC